MAEYHGQQTLLAAPSRPQAPASPVKRIPKFATIPSKYKLKDHPIYPSQKSSKSTYKDEYLQYKNAPVSSQDTDLLTYWEVDARLPFAHLRLIHN